SCAPASSTGWHVSSTKASCPKTTSSAPGSSASPTEPSRPSSTKSSTTTWPWPWSCSTNATAAWGAPRSKQAQAPHTQAPSSEASPLTSRKRPELTPKPHVLQHVIADSACSTVLFEPGWPPSPPAQTPPKDAAPGSRKPTASSATLAGNSLQKQGKLHGTAGSSRAKTPMSGSTLPELI